MHNIIHKGVIEKDRWPHGHIKSLTDWEELPHKSGTAVQLEQEQLPAPLFKHLDVIELIATGVADQVLVVLPPEGNPQKDDRLIRLQ